MAPSPDQYLYMQVTRASVYAAAQLWHETISDADAAFSELGDSVKQLRPLLAEGHELMVATRLLFEGENVQSLMEQWPDILEEGLEDYETSKDELQQYLKSYRCDAAPVCRLAGVLCFSISALCQRVASTRVVAPTSCRCTKYSSVRILHMRSMMFCTARGEADQAQSIGHAGKNGLPKTQKRI